MRWSSGFVFVKPSDAACAIAGALQSDRGAIVYRQRAAASHVPKPHTTPFGLAHAVPAGGAVHVAEQQEAGVPLASPSSHSSFGPIAPSPHVGTTAIHAGWCVSGTVVTTVFVTGSMTDSVRSALLPTNSCVPRASKARPRGAFPTGIVVTARVATSIARARLVSLASAHTVVPSSVTTISLGVTPVGTSPIGMFVEVSNRVMPTP